MQASLYNLSAFLKQSGLSEEANTVFRLLKYAQPDFGLMWDSLKDAERSLGVDLKLPSKSRGWTPQLEESFKLWAAKVSPSIGSRLQAFYSDQNGDGKASINRGALNAYFGQNVSQLRHVTISKVTREYLSKATPHSPNQQLSRAERLRRQMPASGGTVRQSGAGVITQYQLQQSGQSIGIPFSRKGKWYVYMSHASGGKLLGPFDSKEKASEGFKKSDPKTFEQKKKFDAFMERANSGEFDAARSLGPDATGEKSRAAAEWSGRHGHDELSGNHGHMSDTSFTDYLGTRPPDSARNNNLPLPPSQIPGMAGVNK